MHILSHHTHKTSNYPRNSKGIHLLSHRASQRLQSLSPHPPIGPLDLGEVRDLPLVSAVRGDNRTGGASLHSTECLAHSRRFATHRHRKGWLFGGEGSRTHSVPTTVLSVDPTSCDYMPVLASVLGKLPFLCRLEQLFLWETFLDTSLSQNYCSLLYLSCTDEVSPSGSCPTPDSDEVCLIPFPGHQKKQTTEHLPLGYAFSHCCIYHDDTCVRKAQYPPKRCENHKLYFSSLFFRVSNLGAQCVP